MKRARVWITGWLVLVLAFTAAACGGKNGQQPEDSPQNVSSGLEDNGNNTEEPVEEPAMPYREPLTGRPSDVEKLDRPAAVIVENQYHARPQSGLHLADIVYEILAEGDITRFVAFYQSQEPDTIGPVRSIRPYFIQLSHAMDALIYAAGWSPAAKEMLLSGQYAFVNEVYGGDHVYFWRSKERKAPHNVYTSMENIRKGAQDKKYRTEWQPPELSFYEEDERPVGSDAQTVGIRYIGSYRVTYEYDAATDTYLRSMEGEPHTDKETGTRLTAANILICRTDHRILDKEGRREINVRGPGSGYLAQGGKMREITWELKDGLIRAYADGEELKLVPGQTWIHVVPQNAEVTFE